MRGRSTAGPERMLPPPRIGVPAPRLPPEARPRARPPMIHVIVSRTPRAAEAPHRQKWTPITGQGDKCTPPPLVVADRPREQHPGGRRRRPLPGRARPGLRVLPVAVRERGGQEGRRVLHPALHGQAPGGDAPAVPGASLRPVPWIVGDVRAVRRVHPGACERRPLVRSRPRGRGNGNAGARRSCSSTPASWAGWWTAPIAS